MRSRGQQANQVVGGELPQGSHDPVGRAEIGGGSTLAYKTHRCHTGAPSGGDAGRGIFDGDAPTGIYLKARCGNQKRLRVRLAPADVLSGHYRFKARVVCDPAERQLCTLT